MIFLTVGHQMPFDRLVQAVDTWAGENLHREVFAQVGRSRYRPGHMHSVEELDASEFREKVARAEFVVSHAGTGNILLTLELGTPIVVMPRRADLRETRNDHQSATVRWFRRFSGVYVAVDEIQLPRVMDKIRTNEEAAPLEAAASPDLIDAIARFLDGYR